MNDNKMTTKKERRNRDMRGIVSIISLVVLVVVWSVLSEDVGWFPALVYVIAIGSYAIGLFCPWCCEEREEKEAETRKTRDLEKILREIQSAEQHLREAINWEEYK